MCLNRDQYRSQTRWIFSGRNVMVMKFETVCFTNVVFDQRLEGVQYSDEVVLVFTVCGVQGQIEVHRGSA
jgi:hypothetical protein